MQIELAKTVIEDIKSFIDTGRFDNATHVIEAALVLLHRQETDWLKSMVVTDEDEENDCPDYAYPTLEEVHRLQKLQEEVSKSPEEDEPADDIDEELDEPETTLQRSWLKGK